MPSAPKREERLMFEVKRRDGKYYHLFGSVGGRRIRKCLFEENYELAKAKAQTEILKLKTGGIDAMFLKPPTLTEFSGAFLEWVKSCPREDKTKKTYEHGWQMLSKTKLAGLPMDSNLPHEAEMVSFPGGPYNANQALRTLSRMLHKAKELGKIAEIPKIALRKETPRSIEMSREDAALIASKMPEGDCRDAFVVLRGTGMRPMECFSMSWEFFHWEEMYYQNPKGKTKTSTRAVPLHDSDALAVLRGRWATAGQLREGWVFPSSKSKTGHIMSIKHEYNDARDAAGLPKSMVL